MFDSINKTIQSLKFNSDKILPERQELLDVISESIIGMDKVDINFICTHNSRRSQLAQVWCHVLTDHFELNNIKVTEGDFNETLEKSLNNSKYDLIYFDGNHSKEATIHYFEPRE